MRRWLIAVLIMATACGTARPQPPRAASNKVRAEREAARLLALTRVPSGARTLKTPPRSLDFPVIGEPKVQSLVVRTRLWQINWPPKQTLAWLHAHPPAGLTGGASAGGTDGGGYGYTALDTAALTNRELEIGVAPLGAGRTAIRADALAVWLDSTPYPDNSPGRRMRVTIAGGCPRTDAKRTGVRNSGADLSRMLLPATRPTAGLVCSYVGMNGRPFTRKTRKRLDARAAGALATAVRAVRLAHVDGGVSNCPMDDGSVDVLVFAYPQRAGVDLWFNATGCRWIANGSIRASASGFGDGVARWGANR